MDEFVSLTRTAISHSSAAAVSSTLELKNIDSSHSGTYWCQPIVNSTHRLTKGSLFYLLIPNAYHYGQEAQDCAKGVTHKRNTTECAEFVILPPSQVAADITSFLPTGTPAIVPSKTPQTTPIPESTGGKQSSLAPTQSTSPSIKASTVYSTSSTVRGYTVTEGLWPTPGIVTLPMTDPDDPCDGLDLVLILSIALFGLVVVIVVLLVIGVIIWMW